MEHRTLSPILFVILAAFVSLCLYLFITVSVYRQPVYPARAAIQETHRDSLCSVLQITQKPCDEKRIAEHFELDTLPGLIKIGFIKQYQRTDAGTFIAVDGKLWPRRSPYFKQCLLTEVLVYNTFHGYEVFTHVVDSISGKLFAGISASAALNFYD